MIRLLVTRDNINHRGTTVNRGDIIEEDDRNHIGMLQSVGCEIYKGEPPVPKPAPAPAPEPVEEISPREPEPAKKTAKKKAARSKTDKESKGE